MEFAMATFRVKSGFPGSSPVLWNSSSSLQAAAAAWRISSAVRYRMVVLVIGVTRSESVGQPGAQEHRAEGVEAGVQRVDVRHPPAPVVLLQIHEAGVAPEGAGQVQSRTYDERIAGALGEPGSDGFVRCRGRVVDVPGAQRQVG